MSGSSPTNNAYAVFEAAYNHFNHKLFDDCSRADKNVEKLTGVGFYGLAQFWAGSAASFLRR